VGTSEHWQGVYRDRSSLEVSWYEREPAMSLRLLDAAGLTEQTSVIDVGGGASLLVDRLVERGVADVTVLDIAEPALTVSRNRLGPAGERVAWIADDLLAWQPSRRYDLWHDRAVFHFLTDPADRAAYAAVLGAALSLGGRAVVATFAPDGPQFCSGLPVARYGPADLAKELGLRLLREEREEHLTPAGVLQPFTWTVLARD
jgi:SAM-dependent methyltransferase